MVIVQLNGGLGNQMFQYAAGMALAIHRRSELKVDTSALSNDQQRKFELGSLHVRVEIASPEEIQELIPANSIRRIIERIKPYSKKRFYNQDRFAFDEQFFRLGTRVYLRGFFQSEKYFIQVADRIRKEFQPRTEWVASVENKAREFQQEQSVAIHIRRGDYHRPESARYHGILNMDYYQNAIRLLKSRISNPRFHIFTDDPELSLADWGIENADLISGVVSKTHFEDLYLMSRCRHNIIANSSFSWWAAWLNSNPEKIVIAPKKWFDEGPKDTQDLIPEGWIQI